MNYHVAHEDEKSFTVRHPDGSFFKIAKSGIDENTVKRIQGMPKAQFMSNGGIAVDPDSSSTPDPVAKWGNISSEASRVRLGLDPDPNLNGPQIPPDTTPFLDKVQSFGQNLASDLHDKYDPSATPAAPNLSPTRAPSAGDSSPIATPNAGQPGPDAPPTPTPTPNPIPTPTAPAGNELSLLPSFMQDALKAQQGAIWGMAKAKAQEGKENQAAIGNYLSAQPSMNELQTQAQQLHQSAAQIQGENEELYHKVLNGKIDTNRVWTNMSTGNKTMAVIGMILSGMGSGGDPNKSAALQILNKTIDQDIDAQKTDLSNQSNLLSHNMQRYRDINAAEAATRVQMGTVLQAQLAQSAAKSGSAQAIAAAQQASAALKTSMFPYVQQLVQYQAQAPLTNGQGVKEVSPLISNNKEIAESLVYDPVTKNYYKANSKDQAKELGETLSAYTPTMSILQRMQDLGTTGKLSSSGQEAQSLRAQLTLALNKLHGLKRLSDKDIEVIQEQADDPNSWATMLTRGSKTSSLIQGVKDDVEAMKQQYIPNYKGPNAIKSYKPLGKT